jgi:hypothetical protein
MEILDEVYSKSNPVDSPPHPKTLVTLKIAELSVPGTTV